MSTVTSCPGEAELRKLVEATLNVPEQTSVTEHVESCPACQAALERVSGGGGWAERISEKLSLREDSGDQSLQEAVNRLIDRLRNDRVAAATILEGVSIADTKLDFLRPSDKPEVLGTLGSYEITEVIGRGGMGVVLKGFDPRLNRFVAVKVLAPETASNPTARRRFLREAQAAAAISHDHVVTIHAVDESELPYLVMEYVSGMSLQELLDQKGALELKQMLRIGMQTASGLAAAHAQGLVHRDIKPANILLENGVQRVKITDFGLARAVDDVGMTQTGVVTGTPLFMSPEQARGEPIDHRTDLFSLGSVLYTMCTGRAPFRAETTMGVLRRVCEDTPRPIQEVNAEIPDWLCAVVERLLEKNPNDRFQSAAEVAEQLGAWLAYLQQPASAARPVTIAPRKRPWTLRKAARMVGSGVGDLVLGIVTLCAMMAVITLVRGYFFGEERGVGFALTSQNGSLIIDVNDPTITEIRLSARDEAASRHLKGVSSLDFQLNGQRRLDLPDSLGPGLYQISFRREGPALFEDQAVRIRSNETKQVSVPVGRSPVRETNEAADPRGSSGQPQLQAVLRDDTRTGKVVSLAVSPGGWWVAAGCEDGAIHVWDVPTSRVVVSWQLSPHPVRAIAFSPDGRWLAVAHQKDTSSWMLRVSSVSSLHGRPVRVDFMGSRELSVPGAGVRSLTFSFESRLLLAGAGDESYGEIFVWTTTDYEQIAQHAGFRSAVRWLFAVPEDHLVLAGTADGRTKVIDLNSGKVEQDIGFGMTGDPTKTPVPLAFAFTPTNVPLLTWGDEQGRIRTNHPQAPDGSFQAHESAIAAVALSPDGRLLATAGQGSEVKIWSIERLQAAESEPLSASRLIEMLGDRARRIVEKAYRPSWSPDRRSILYTDSDETELKIVDLESREVRTLVRAADYFADSGVVDGVWSPDGKRIAFVQRPKARREDRLHREEICLVNADGTGVRRLASGGYPSWSADSTRIYFQDRHRDVLRSIEAGRENAEPQDIIACKGLYPIVSPDEKYVAFGVANELTIAALGTKKVVATWKAPVPLSGMIVGWSPDSQELSIGGYTSEWIGFWIYDLRSRQAERVWNAPVSDGAWSTDGRRFAFIVRGSKPELWVADLEPGSSTSAALRRLVSSRAEEP